MTEQDVKSFIDPMWDRLKGIKLTRDLYTTSGATDLGLWGIGTAVFSIFFAPSLFFAGVVVVWIALVLFLKAKAKK